MQNSDNFSFHPKPPVASRNISPPIPSKPALKESPSKVLKPLSIQKSVKKIETKSPYTHEGKKYTISAP